MKHGGALLFFIHTAQQIKDNGRYISARAWMCMLNLDLQTRFSS